ncbi:hypothetical protein [Rahnella aquatilis]|uniref:hypothetical protein n=1 Tax=Rahnella aquatilis TaxID=34038 RepID=UPI00365B1AF3
MKKIAVILGLLIAAPSAYAVDGYKNIKFGSSIDEVKNAHVCSMKDYKADTPGMDSIVCNDFKFSGGKTQAFAIFLNGKFERFAILLRNNDTDAIITGLKDKYGTPSSTSSQDELQEAVKNGGNIFIKFDNDTVVFQGSRDSETLKDTGFLIYTTSDYDSKLTSLKSKEFKEDL